jgi:hypothetical protein
MIQIDLERIAINVKKFSSKWQEMSVTGRL